jgi:tight adherence protein C
MIDLIPILVPALSFAAVAAVVFVLGQHLATQAQMQRRLPAAQSTADLPAEQPLRGLDAFVARHFSENRFGIKAGLRDKLRRKLLDAGYFKRQAVNYYVFARVACVIIMPAAVYVLTELFTSDAPRLIRLMLVSVAFLIGLAGPDFYLVRRQRTLAQRYRQVFPDLLDLLVVCVDAGLSLEVAFDRITGEISKRSRELGMHLEIMGAEMRAGRSTVEALESLADRVGLDEAGSFVAMLRQSIELGSDIGDALRVFSDEMRDKRLLRAEEKANKLSVKMVIPLGLFIFPVVLLVTILPVMIKLMRVIGNG